MGLFRYHDCLVTTAGSGDQPMTKTHQPIKKPPQRTGAAVSAMTLAAVRAMAGSAERGAPGRIP
jgi:hypothetical protein